MDRTAHSNSSLAAHLGREGRVSLQQYYETGEEFYLDNSINLARQALEISLPPERGIYLNDLGCRLKERFDAHREIRDISEALQVTEHSSQVISDPSQRAVVLNNLATYFSVRFELSQNTDDLERGILAADQALDLSSSSVGFQAKCKNTLCLLYGDRFWKLGILDDLENAARMAQEAVDVADRDDPDRAMFMGHLGVCYERRFERLGDPADINKAIDCAREALDSIDDGNTMERSSYLSNLSNALGRRFSITDNPQDIEDAIGYVIESINLLPGGHPRRPGLLHNGSLLLEDRFMRLQDMDDLDDAIELEEYAVSVITADDPKLVSFWDQLGAFFSRKFDFSGEMTHLNKSIEYGQMALDAIFDSTNSDAALYKLHMALALSRRFERLDEVKDLDRAILLGTQALDIIPGDDPRRIDLLLSVGNFWYDKYTKSGSMEHFELAFTLTQEAMKVDVPHGFDQPRRLCTISNRFRQRYKLTGIEDYIRKSIQLAQTAADMIPPVHPIFPYCLWRLSLAFETRYLSHGSLSDLERCIQACQDAISSAALDRLGRFDMLYSWSVQLTYRYEQFGALVDLNEAIELMQQSKDGAPENYLHQAVCLKTLSDQLGYLYERNNDVSILTQASDAAKQALTLYPNDSIGKASILNSLGLLLKSRFDVTNSPDDLKEAVDVQRDALRIVPKEDPERSIALHNVSVSLADLFQTNGDAQCLIEAIRIGWEAVNAVSESHPNRAMYLNEVGMLYKKQSDRAGAIITESRTPASLFSEALCHDASPPLDRIKAGKNAFHCHVMDGSWNEAIAVARDVVKLLPLLVPRWMSRADQQHLLKNLSHFTSLAASAALQANEPAISALDILETGRGVIAGLVVDLKKDIAKLEMIDPTLYLEYTQLRRRILLPISSSLSQVGAAQSFITPNGRREPHSHPTRIDAAGPARAKDLQSLEELENKIRALPGFENFFEHLSQGDYMSLARLGPIVAFNVTELRSDAIIITNNNITIIRLTKLHFRDLKINAIKVTGPDQLARGAPSTKRERNQELQNILQWLWDTAVCPVLTELGLYGSENISNSPLPRIWWVTSGYIGLLPMHASGNGKGATTMDYVVSSYVPTLRVLKFSQMRESLLPRCVNPKVLVVTAPEKSGQQNLEVEADIRSIKEGLKGIASYTVLDTPSSADVLRELPENHLIHFSCHGSSSPSDPSDSALVLSPTAENGTHSYLTVKDLEAIDHDNAQLAYLSACSTAENSSDDLLDEIIHVASAFQVMGFPNVIGTLWEVDDGAAVRVCQLFYKAFGRRMALGHHFSESIAYALHEALQQHRKSKRVMRSNDVLSWAPFIHFGA
ncbi:hypothetical protein PHISCL_01454 [Aspergillus sclerotialis]|uniref:CHAT domain-containing protein n=1 Tax=Aspergillus sclerotialis TaxID=2070753 RepID=A0A3A2ZT18_9EURO|nr:hypothetical protein PHISCL_01454 [Aspergillus sclerotialis]